MVNNGGLLSLMRAGEKNLALENAEKNSSMLTIKSLFLTQEN